MSYFVYIVECADQTYYCGLTTDLKRRIEEHNSSKKGARYTKSRRPVFLKYSEELESHSTALKREAEIKKWPRKNKKSLWIKD